MARMIPPQIGLHSDPPPGEEMLFGRFREAPETEEWIVLHSLDVARHRSRISGEIDFVLLIPGRGVLCVEVKSHRHIVYDRGRWLYGPEQKQQKDPFQQVRETMHSLLDDVKERHADLRQTLFWSSVCFPQTKFRSHSSDTSSPEWHDWELIDAERLEREGVTEAFDRVLRRAAQFLEKKVEAGWFQQDRSLPTRGECERIAGVLRPHFEFFESPASRAQRREEELKHYTEQQFLALDHMERNPRVLFEGPAGTGKTFLALEAARRAGAREEKTLFICYNRNLGNWLRDATADIGSVEAGTLHSRLLDLAEAKPSDEEEFWSKELPDRALENVLKTGSPVYDRLIVDEAQDILQPAYLDVLDVLLDGGLQMGKWLIAGDFVNQNIYSGSTLSGSRTVSPEEFLEQRNLSVPRFSLAENCRNTPEVANFIEKATDMEPGYREVLRPEKEIDPVILTGESPSEQAAELQSVLENLYDEGITGEDIILLSPRRLDSDRSIIQRMPDVRWRQRIRGYRDEGDGYIRHSTIQAFKGLEAPAVVILGLEDLTTDRGKELLYVGASRSQERLYMLMTKSEKDTLLTAVLQGKGS